MTTEDRDKLKERISKIIFDELDSDPFAKIASNQYHVGICDDIADKILTELANKDIKCKCGHWRSQHVVIPGGSAYNCVLCDCTELREIVA